MRLKSQPRNWTVIYFGQSFTKAVRFVYSENMNYVKITGGTEAQNDHVDLLIAIK